MSTFVRFIVLVLVLGAVVNLAMVLYSNERSRRKQLADAAQERQEFGRAMGRMSDKLRRAEMAVEWQKVDAKDKVVQTSLLVRQFVVAEDEQRARAREALPVMRVVIPGSEVCVDGIRLEFGEKFPAEYEEMRGKNLSLFVHVYAEETKEKDRFTFWPVREVPVLVRAHGPDQDPHVTYFEMSLWQTVSDLVQTPERAEKYYDLKILTPEKVASLKACQVVRNGGFYELNVGLNGVTIRESNNWVDRNVMLEEGKKLKDEAEGK